MPMRRAAPICLVLVLLSQAFAAQEACASDSAQPLSPGTPRKGPPATFPRTGVLRIGSTPGAPHIATSLRPGLQLVIASPETVYWGPTDFFRQVMVRVLDGHGDPPRDGASQPVSIPILFEITRRPTASTGTMLAGNAQQDTSRLLIPSDAGGMAGVILQRGSGSGVYQVTASLPDEFGPQVLGNGLRLDFVTFTQGTSRSFTNLQVEPGHVANGVDSATVFVRALDFMGVPVPNALLGARLHAAHDDKVFEVPLHPVGSGNYMGRMVASSAGWNAFVVTDLVSGATGGIAAHFLHSPPAAVALTLDGGLETAGVARAQRLQAIVVDADDQPFDFGERTVQFMTSAGVLTLDGPDSAAIAVHGATLTYDSLGTVQVIAQDVASGVADTLDVLFPAVSLVGGPRAVFHLPSPGTTTRFAVPLSVYVPPEFLLDTLRATIQYPADRVRLVSCNDGDPSDPYTAVVTQDTPGSVTVTASAAAGPPGNGRYIVTGCWYDCTAAGPTPFSLGTASMRGTPSGAGAGARMLENGTVALPVEPAEPTDVNQKMATKTLCLNIMVAPRCMAQKAWIEEAFEKLKLALAEACCTIELSEEITEVEGANGGVGQSKWTTGDDGAEICGLSRSAGDMIRRTQKNRKPECMNIYVVFGIDGDVGAGLLGGTEAGQACNPNDLDGDGNVEKGSIVGVDGKPLKGGDGKPLSDKQVSSAFVNSNVGKETFINTMMHEFGHMMGLPHSEETKDKTEDDGANNPMHAKNGKGTSFAPFQCEWIMKDVNGFLQDKK